MAEQKKTATRKKAATATVKKATVKKAPGKAAAKKKSTARKAAPKKTAAPKKSTARKTRDTTLADHMVSEEMRLHMIREAAYYRALQRGFGGNAEMEDWYAAEQEIDRMLGRLTK